MAFILLASSGFDKSIKPVVGFISFLSVRSSCGQDESNQPSLVCFAVFYSSRHWAGVHDQLRWHRLAPCWERLKGSAPCTLHGNGTVPRYNASTTFNVTGRTSFGHTEPGRYDNKGGAIIAGTIGHSAIIDRLVREGKVDVSEIEGKWESYTSTVVDDPVQGVSQAVVIAGKGVP
jgi:hypothetical protein